MYCSDYCTDNIGRLYIYFIANKLNKILVTRFYIVLIFKYLELYLIFISYLSKTILTSCLCYKIILKCYNSRVRMFMTLTCFFLSHLYYIILFCSFLHF